VHKTTSAKLVNNYPLEGYSESQKANIIQISQKISLGSLARIWQMLLKGSNEINFSSSPKMAFEMLMVRICHLVALPKLQDVLLNLGETKSDVAIKVSENNDDIINEILRNFEGAKIL